MPLMEPRTRLSAPEPWTLKGRDFIWGARTYVMGIVNVTPDSFSDGGRVDPAAAIAHAERLLADGADLLDIGGESTRPGSVPVSAEEELARILPVIRALAARGAALSVDTFKPEVAAQALEAGADLINDISGLRDPEMLAVAARYGAPVIAMHMQGMPQTMQDDPRYDDVVSEVHAELVEAVRKARARGVKVMVDPGIGFGKTQEHNLTLLRHLDRLHVEGCPMLLGTSRKGFIGKLLDLPVNERVEGTMATVALGVSQGVDVVRVHDVKEAVRTVKVADAIARRP
ncbi:Dihydropteroate synthase [compost metagenome]